MKNVTLRKNFKVLSDLKLIELATIVLSKVNEPIQKAVKLDEIVVPHLSPSHAEMEELITAFNEAVLVYGNKGKVEKVVRDLKRLALENALKLWALQVEVFAKGDVEILINSGFGLSKQPEPIPHPGKPLNFKVSSTGRGELTLSVKKVKGVLACEFELKETNADHAMLCSQGNTKCVQRNLKSGSCYQCRVAYIGKTEHKVYSDYINCYVL